MVATPGSNLLRHSGASERLKRSLRRSRPLRGPRRRLGGVAVLEPRRAAAVAEREVHPHPVLVDRPADRRRRRDRRGEHLDAIDDDRPRLHAALALVVEERLDLIGRREMDDDRRLDVLGEHGTDRPAALRMEAV